MLEVTQRKRELGSLAMSVGIHAGLAILGSLAWAAVQNPPPPRPVEVEFLKLPPPVAPEQGQPLPGEVEREDADRQKASSTPAASKAATRPDRLRAKAAARTSPGSPAGPSVQASFRVAQAGFDPAEHPDRTEPALIAHWQPAAKLAVDPTRREQQPSFALAGFGGRALSGRSQAKWRGEAGAGADSGQRAEVDPDLLPFHLHDHGAGGMKRLLPAWPKPEKPGGDPRALIERIQSRIDKVAPLVHRTSQGCRDKSGLARIRFVMDANGYPIGYQLLSSAGNACLDTQIDIVLHLAEPYPFVAGWVPVQVKFTL